MDLPIEGLDRPAITLAPGSGRAESSLRRLKLGDQPFLVLKQRGAFADIAYDHGRLLAEDIDGSSFPEIVSTIARAIDRDSETLERIGAVIYRCYSDRVLRNTSPEFRRAVDAVAEGYFAGSRKAQFTLDDVRDAVIAIEVSNLIEGLARLSEIRFVRVRALLGLVALSLPYVFDRRVMRTLRHLRSRGGVQASLRHAIGNLSSPRARCGMACTAFCASGQHTADGRHIHARNFDADLYQWNAAPVLALIDETPGHAGWHKYVAFGTAGLIYPGGISGLNDAGLAVSLHQMSTTRYRSGFLVGQGDIAPFVEQRILREAATLDEAVDIARSTMHFAAWTIFCSHARSGEGMRIELNADKVRIMRDAAPMPQTNHFLHADMIERQFDSSDGHFTPSFGKWLETHARLRLVERRLAELQPRTIDVDWAIELLASGKDWYLERLAEELDGAAAPQASMRSFGRVPRKAYGQLTSIARGDPARRPGHDEVWVTSGDRRPACHSTYLGWRVSWEPFDVEPAAERPLRRTSTLAHASLTRWEESFQFYVEACIAVTRPKEPGGGFMARDPNDAEHEQALTRAIDLLGRAIDLAAADGVTEIPYHYMRARLRHEIGDPSGAKADWDLLFRLWTDQKAAAKDGGSATHSPLMHPYEAALVLILSSATEDLLTGTSGWQGRAERLAEARALLAKLADDTFGTGRRAHFDIAKWRKLAERIEREGALRVELPDENFITAE